MIITAGRHPASDSALSMAKDTLGSPVWFLLLATALFSCAGRHHATFDAAPPAQKNLSALEIRLQDAVAASPHLSMDRIGQVNYPGFQAALQMVHFQAVPSPRRRILINAAIHGNEPASAEAAVRFIEILSGSPDRYEDAAIDIIPIVNPWGWVHDTRYNQAGIDINRDFSTFRSQEAVIIRQNLQHAHYDLMLDLHEDPTASGFYLYQYGLRSKSVCEKIVSAVKDMGYPIELNVKMVALKTENGIIDAPMWGLWYMRLTGQLSIANYYRMNNSRFVFTVETPTGLLWEDRLKMQHTAVIGLIEQFAGGS